MTQIGFTLMNKTLAHHAENIISAVDAYAKSTRYKVVVSELFSSYLEFYFWYLLNKNLVIRYRFLTYLSLEGKGRLTIFKTVRKKDELL